MSGSLSEIADSEVKLSQHRHCAQNRVSERHGLFTPMGS
jgi:hypothetical protein